MQKELLEKFNSLRDKLEMNQRDFGVLFDLSISSVSRYQNHNSDFTSFHEDVMDSIEEILELKNIRKHFDTRSMRECLKSLGVKGFAIILCKIQIINKTPESSILHSVWRTYNKFIK